MKNIYRILNKKFDKTLFSRKEEKDHIANIKTCLEAYHIPNEGKEDSDIIQYEVIYRSLLVKQKFEEVFFDTYVKMFDYWYDLTYLERKQQMNVDIDCLLEDLTCFQVEEEMIYMPCFEPSFNHLYSTEIVLLDLKQYHKYIKECASEVKANLYGVLPYTHGFSSCEVMAASVDAFVLYHKGCNRLYLYRNNKFVSFLSFDPKCKDEENLNSLQEIASFMIVDEEMQLLDVLLESNLIRKKMKKKIQKYKMKLEKKIAKQKAKEKSKKEQ